MKTAYRILKNSVVSQFLICGSLLLAGAASASYSGTHVSVSATSPIAPGQSLNYSISVRNSGTDWWDAFDQPGWIHVIRSSGVSWSVPWSSITTYVWNDVAPGANDLDPDTLASADLPSAPGAYYFMVYTYCPVDDFSGNYTLMSGSPRRVDFTIAANNQIPVTPANILPVAGASNQSLTPTLRATVFSDPNAGDTHAASQWVVRKTSDSSIVFDSGEDTINRTNRSVPAGVLAYGAGYGWQVRYKDNRGGWSGYSAQTTFSTLLPTLASRRQGAGIVHSWSTNAVGFVLVATTNLATNAIWNPVMPLPVVIAGQNVVTNATADSRKFYRLRKP